MFAATFTIVGWCPKSAELGVALSTAIPGGGAICPFVSRHGALSSQSFNNFYFGVDGQALLIEGLRAAEVGEALLRDDPGRARRQLLIIDATGSSWAFTGSACVRACGHRLGDGYAVAGNMLVAERVLDAMAQCFESSSRQSLAERLLATLEAGDAAGGDSRGKQSSALKVASRTGAIPICDLRVDEHVNPVAELRRVYEIAKIQLFPFMRSMPTRGSPEGTLTDELSAYLGRKVEDR